MCRERPTSCSGQGPTRTTLSCFSSVLFHLHLAYITSTRTDQRPRQPAIMRLMPLWMSSGGGGSFGLDDDLVDLAGDVAFQSPESSWEGCSSESGGVQGGVVGGGLLPAGPDDPEPGTGEDAGGVGVALATGPGVGIQAPGPGRGQACVVGEGGQGLASSTVGGPAEIDPAGLGRGLGHRRRAALGGGLLGAGDAVQDRPDLSQQLGQVDGADPGQ